MPGSVGWSDVAVAPVRRVRVGEREAREARGVVVWFVAEVEGWLVCWRGVRWEIML